MYRSSSYDVTPRRGYGERAREERVEEYSQAGLVAEVWTMNAIAVGLALAALALFIVGMLIGTGATGGNNLAVQQAEKGAIWLLGALSLVITAAIFRREHHIVDPSEMQQQEEEREGGFYR